MFKTDCDHDNHSNNPSRGLSDEMKKFVREKFNEGISKPNSILAVMRKKKISQPPKSKLISYLRSLREEVYGPATVSANEISVWCEAMKKIPVDEDKPFVLEFEVNAESTNPDEQDLKIVISSKRLLSIAQKSDMVQADATYKLVWQGYPVLILGTSDQNRVFHPFAMAVCKGESGADFAFVFNAVRSFNLEWQPTVLMADASEAITKGFEQVFGAPKKRLMCFFHVLKNLDKFLKPLIKGGVCVKLKNDIHALQRAQDDETFLKASELFLKKWSTSPDYRIQDFVKYFQSHWLQQNFSWYEGAGIGYPSTNNGIEATNAVIKQAHTLRERLPVGQFLHSVTDVINNWSMARNPSSVNVINFATSPTISLQQWIDAYHWVLQNKKILRDQHPDYTIFYVNSSLTKSEIDIETLPKFQILKCKWQTFDDFNFYSSSVWIIKIVFRNLDASSCNCPTFFKQYSCKHIIGMKIKLKLLSVPPAVKSVPLGQKRKKRATNSR